MRDLSKRTRVLAAAAVLVLAALMPGPVSGTRRALDGRMPGVSVLIKVFAPRARETTVAAPSTVTTPVADDASLAPRRAGAAAVKVVDVVVPVDKGIYDLDQDTYGDPFGAGQQASSSSGPCAKATTCASYLLRPARWKTDKTGKLTIPWKFNDQGRRNLRAPAGLLESAVRSSMAQWSKWNSNIVFTYAGPTAAAFGATGKDGSCADGTNVITWDRFDPEIVAEAGLCMDRTGKVIRDADLALNVTYHWEDVAGTPKSRHSFDIRSITTHELGHWLGLLDLYSGSDVHQTMSGSAEYGQTNKRTPALGDIIGIQTAYPCDKTDVCPRKGIADD